MIWCIWNDTILTIRKFYRILPFKPVSLKKAFLKFTSSVDNFFMQQNCRKTVIRKIKGIRYQLQLNQLIDSSIYYQGCFEKDTTNAITKLCFKGMTSIDIGANIGCHTLLMAKLAGPSGKIIAFEPTNWAFQKLQKNVSLNSFTNIILEKLALSNETVTNNVYFKSSWSIDSSSSEETDKRQTIKFTTLDNYVKTQDISRIDLIKIDVDGYEYKIIQGAAETLKAFKPKIIMELCAYTLRDIGDRIEDLVSYLASLGYKFYQETDMSPFLSLEFMLSSIPEDGSINVVVM